MDIISLIIIIVVIKKVIKKAKEIEKLQQKRPSGAQMYQQMQQRRQTGEQSYRQPQHLTREQAYQQAQQQRATKERLQQKYGVSSKAPFNANADTEKDILSRAKTNVREEAADTFKQQAHAEVCAEYRSHAEVAADLTAHKGHSPECDFEGESDLVKRVNDLIVMGYSGEMDFERDFVAEGVEMLNSFSL